MKFENILRMSGDDRFGYFVRKIADFKKVWGLFNNGWAMGKDDHGNTAVLFWPEIEFAAAYATGIFANHVPKEIDLAHFIAKWIPGMNKDQFVVAVFPTPSRQAVFVTPDSLLAALNEEQEGLEEEE